jgi:acetyl esterase/lipase
MVERFLAYLGITVAVLASIACGGRMNKKPAVMSAADVLALPQPTADAVISYGDDELQKGELRLPTGDGPHPVVVVIHGGCWLAEYDLGHISGLADALTESGVATWSIEYRRVGDDGGGWPGTFADVAAATDFLREIAADHDLDLDRVVTVGHSAGGHLALWLAGRRLLDIDDSLRGEEPLRIGGVVSLAGIPDLAGYASKTGCGAAVSQLLGGEPTEVPDRLGRASPIELLPLGIPLILVVGELDTIVPASQAHAYQQAARRMGDTVEIREIGGAGHFELVDPERSTFDVVRRAVGEAVAAADLENQPDPSKIHETRLR